MGFEGAVGLTFLVLVGNSTDWINPDQSVLGIRVERKAAPRPILRVIDQSSLQRIHVHVVKLLDSLLQAPDVEVVKPSLPNSRR